jgi:hypothetical protein
MNADTDGSEHFCPCSIPTSIWGDENREISELSDKRNPERERASVGPRTQRTQGTRRTPPKQMARQLARHLRVERPDYDYLKQVFRCLRAELEVEIPRVPKRLPYVPSEEQIRRYYQAVWESRNFGDMVLIKTCCTPECE